MHIFHLTASTLFGGPERQMLGLAQFLPARFTSSYASFPEGGRSSAFLNQVRQAGFVADTLIADTPNIPEAVGELTRLLRSRSASLLVCHTFKPNVLGRIAARRVGIPIVAVSRGWTWENLKVRAYESIDRVNLRFVDQVIAVSDGQAERVRRCGVPRNRITVIRNAARLAAFADPKPEYRSKLQAFFPNGNVSHLILAAGRLSTEKGFDVLLESVPRVLSQHPNCGFVLFGEGVERAKLQARIVELGLSNQFLMPGHTVELDQYLPWADLVVLPSHTEGLPNVALEASAAGVPVVATAVGGTPEVIADGISGLLVPPAQPGKLADSINKVLSEPGLKARLGVGGRERMQAEYTFEAQAQKYAELFDRLTQKAHRKMG
jgi:glycosyltransferase involved in cell wall biosynthesis